MEKKEEKKEEETIWIRGKDGELSPQLHDLVIKEKLLVKEIEEYEQIQFTLEQKQGKTEDEEKNLMVLIKAIKLLKEAEKEREETHKIVYLPLINCEIDCILQKIGIDGKPTQDIDANICSIKCISPKNSYEYWRDMKNPKLKKSITSFIIKKSLPEIRKVPEAEKQAFLLLQGIVNKKQV